MSPTPVLPLLWVPSQKLYYCYYYYYFHVGLGEHVILSQEVEEGTRNFHLLFLPFYTLIFIVDLSLLQ